MVASLGRSTQLVQSLGHCKCRIPTFGQTFYLGVPKHQLIGTVSHSWSRIRQTEGWAGLQHHSVLHTILTIFPPTNPDDNDPHLPLRLDANLTQGSFFTILPRTNGNRVPKWYSGNIYSMERSLSRIIDLPSTPSLISPTTYDVFVSGDYEVIAPHTEISNGMAYMESVLDPVVW